MTPVALCWSGGNQPKIECGELQSDGSLFRRDLLFSETNSLCEVIP